MLETVFYSLLLVVNILPWYCHGDGIGGAHPYTKYHGLVIG